MGAGQGRSRRTATTSVIEETEELTLDEVFPELSELGMTQLTETLVLSKPHPNGRVSKQYLALFHAREQPGSQRGDKVQVVKVSDTGESNGAVQWQVLDGWETRELRQPRGLQNLASFTYDTIMRENRRLKKEAYQGRISDYELKITAALEKLQEKLTDVRPVVKQLAF